MAYYTYAHIRNDTGKIFYIGKGTRRRAWANQHRNQHWHNVVSKHGHTVEILANWDTSEEACSHEVLLIASFKDMGHKLVNQTDGGEGSTNLSPEIVAKIRASNIGKKRSQETKEKIRAANLGEKNPNFGKTGDKHHLFGTLGNKNPNYKGDIVATCIATGHKIVLKGKAAIKTAGFNPCAVYNCVSGKRPHHKNHTFTRP